jgi:hypothetical protein
MKNTADENQKIISACDRVLARVKACVDAGIDLSDVEFPLAAQSADIDQMFIELEKNAAAPVQVVPTPLESSRPNADKLHYRHQPSESFIFIDPLFFSDFSADGYLYDQRTEVVTKRSLGLYVRPLWLRIKSRILDTRSPSQKLHERRLKRHVALAYLRQEVSK